MKQIETVNALRGCVSAWRKMDDTIAFVPTMGNLHQGHLALVKRAKKMASRVVVSIFVNPMQFPEGTDFERYPRTPVQDIEALQRAGIDALFFPDVSEIYQGDAALTTRVEVPGLSDILCGAFRPGHFVGVTTVVAKLFNMVQPDVAVFGKKDYQQLLLIKRMVADLALPIKVIGVETMRESSGLAMSSRNNYLTVEEKHRAALIYRVLSEIADSVRKGDTCFENLCEYGVGKLQKNGFSVDYVEIRRRSDLGKALEGQEGLVVLIAAKMGDTRLIDNLEIS